MLLFWEMTPGMVSVFSTLLGSTADTCSTLVYVHVRQVPQVQPARRQSRSHCCCLFTPELQYIEKVVDVPVVVHMPVVVQ